MAKFPSEQWFEEVRCVYNSDPTLHSGGGGACTTQAGFKIGAEHYRIVFEGLDVTEVAAVSRRELLGESTDFVIDMPLATWKKMIANVMANGKANRDFTLNSLDLSREDGIAFSPVDDQYRQDLFYRYNQNFQDFFNASSRIKTTFG
jgi:hypothetical protein